MAYQPQEKSSHKFRKLRHVHLQYYSSVIHHDCSAGGQKDRATLVVEFNVPQITKN